MSQTVNLGHVVGPGVPNGGTAGQVLKKNSGTNFDTSWSDNSAANIPMSGSDNTSIGNAMSKILPVITGTTNNSGYAIAAGEYFEANGGLYQATASIPVDNAWSSSATALTDHGAVNALEGNIGSLANLNTNAKNNLVSSVNEVNGKWKSQIKTGTLDENGYASVSFSTIPVGHGLSIVNFALGDLSVGTQIACIGYFIGDIAKQSLNLGANASFGMTGSSDNPKFNMSLPEKPNQTYKIMWSYWNVNPRNM